MKPNFLSAVKVTLSILLTSLALQAQAMSLQEAIKLALEKNPKIRSNDKVLEAMQLRIQGEKKSQLPSVSVGYSISRDMGRTYGSSDSLNSDYSSGYRNGNVSLNWNIFDGGAKKYRIEAMECNFKERQANYNSTNTQIRNTQGQVAGLVVQNYISLSRNQVNIQFSMKILEVLNKVKAIAKTEGEISEVTNFINQMTHDLQEQQSQALLAANDFQYVVTLPAPQQLDTLQEMIDHIQIPQTNEQSMAIALEKSPEIKSARYQVECANLRYKSTHASTYSPHVDVSVGRNFGNRSTDYTTNSYSGSSGTTASISVRMNFGAGSSSELDAQRKEIDSTQDNLDATISDTKHQIEQSYPELVTAIQFTESYKANLATGEERIAKYMNAIDQHQNVSVSDIDKELGNLVGNWYSLQRYTVSVLNSKFQIQKTIGILFESLGLQLQGVSQFTNQ